MAKLNFETLKFIKDIEGKHKLSESQTKMIKSLFNCLPDGNCLYVLNPKHVLSEKVLDVYREENYDFNFNNVKLSRNVCLMKDHKYYWFLTQNKAFPEIYNKLKHDLQYISKKYNIANPTQYYFIVEEDRKNCHLVRGIVKGSLKNGFAIYINPEHEQRQIVKIQTASALNKALFYYEDNDNCNNLEYFQIMIDDCNAKKQEMSMR